MKIIVSISRHVRSELLKDHPGETYARKLHIESQVHGKFRSGDPDGESLILRRYIKPLRMSSPKKRIHKTKSNGSTLRNTKERKRERQRQRARDRKRGELEGQP